MSKSILFFIIITLIPVTGFTNDEILDCYRKSTDGRRNGTIIGAGVGTAAGGGLCAAGILAAGLTFGVTAVVGCGAGAIIGTGTGAYIGSEIGDSTDYKCPDDDK
ncbi:hypothetical protein QUF61_14010 [Candidatus Venteria ishoeyi]|uniref:hypothetical protein n=1 Tax=Candidatus Venteria ishoeyi TaxID=1899563 RepID=UPI0025A68820|nr:hypothetical protein [Candidatus Venteria ishoeyi]MDM8547601.1 hypothetical protein [Candidatus Venteria ishoeyi]